ncbi:MULTISPECIES: hypothetical protein [Sphingomonas]|uniref:hypothetical protein n=1 Tax=Sphingomonas TaxID=13687 RepID=UPI000DEFBB7D|nr:MULTISPECIES: hypothetical protein [Sphingomonas]
MLIEEFVKKGLAPRLSSSAASSPSASSPSCAPPAGWRSSDLLGIDPAEVEKIEQKFARDREILLTRVFGDGEATEELADPGISKERIRQIGKRAAKGMAELAETQSRFTVMAEYHAKPSRLAA